jgi:Mg2+-importing ATPase
MNMSPTPIHQKKRSQSETSLGEAHLLRNLSNLDLRTVYRVLMTSEQGLTEPHVQRALQKHGKNVVAHEPPPPWYRMLLRYVKNPFVLVLLVIGTVSFLTGDLKATVVVSAMVALSVLIQFVQEYRSSQAAERLKALVRNTSTVTRQYEHVLPDGTVKHMSEKREVPFEELVPGDLVHLSAGDMIPADLRLLTSKDLFISQAVLTGESMPVEKYDSLGTRPDTSSPRTDESADSLLERSNLCFMGTTVVSGTGTAVVATTGSHTYFGSMAKSIIGQRPLTSFDRGIARVTWVLLRFMLVMVPVIFVLNGVVKGAWHEALLFSLAVAVGLIPEMLPTVVTATLARGAVAMSRRKVIVKQLNAIQNFGAMDVLCTDKTGTLTQDKIVLLEYLDLYGDKSLPVLERAYLNSYYQTGLKSLLDRAVLDHAELAPHLHVTERYTKVDEIPFDFLRRRMSVIVEQDQAQHLLICKGAVEEMLNICSHVEDGGTVVPLTGELRERMVRLTTDLNQDGLRVIAVASKTLPASDRPYAIADECDLVLAGVLSFLDPPKETVPEALAALDDHGVHVKILTGDNDIVTRRVCHEVGLSVEQVALGNEIDGLSDDDLAAGKDRRALGPVSSLFDIITFTVMWVVFQANSPEHQALFQSGWFIEGLLSQTLIVHMIRTQKIPFLQSTAAAPVLWLTGLIVAIGLSLPFSSLGTFASMQPLPPSYFAWLAAILFSYAALTQLVKGWYLRQFHEWL